MKSDPIYMKAALNIERHTEKDPKRFTTYIDITDSLFFFDSVREHLQSSKPALPEMCTAENMKPFVDEYAQVMNLSMTVEEWFAQLKEV